MKKSARIIALLLVLMLALSLCACGEKEKTAENDAPAATETPATEAPDYTGTYTSFGVKNSDLGLGDAIVSTAGLVDMTFELKADGTGVVNNSGDEAAFTWTVEDGNLTVTNENGDSMYGTVKDGIMEIVITEDGTAGSVFLAKPDADTSSYDVMSLSDIISSAAAEPEN